MRFIVIAVFVSLVCACAAAAAPEAQVEGFASLVSLSGGAIELKQFSYRGEDQTYLERAGDGQQAITWKTAPVPVGATGRVTFAFGVSFLGPNKEAPGEHELLLNGRKLVTITLPPDGDAVWKEGPVEVRFDYLRADRWNDLEGVVYLTVPAAGVRPGQPAELTVHGLASNSKSFFCVSAITNVLADPAAHPAQNPTKFVPPPPPPVRVVPEAVLFDFESAADAKEWTPRTMPEYADPGPAPTVSISKEHATSGKHSLKLTYTGGIWPMIGTDHLIVPGTWGEYETLKLEVTADRPALVAFRGLQEKSKLDGTDWDSIMSRWNQVAYLKAGLNHIQVPIRGTWDPMNDNLGNVKTIMILLHSPASGQTIYVDNVRLSADKMPAATTKFRVRVPGTDPQVSGIAELYNKAPNVAPASEPKTAPQLEAEFRAQYAELKKTHPQALLAIFRQGAPGFDPGRPNLAYTGWKNCYLNSHGPFGPNPALLETSGEREPIEVFMRHRSQLHEVDLSSIPTGSRILAARFVLSLVDLRYDMKEWTINRPNMWVAEPCNRPWVEKEVNGYEYAKGKYWQRPGGVYYGEDADFLPIYLAHGPANGKLQPDPKQSTAVWWDFTEGVRFWTDGKHANHGFMFHGGGGEPPLYMVAHTTRAAEVELRPVLMVVYEGAR